MSSKIYFADCLPGYGKTFWAIKSMTAYHKTKNCVCIYSAPTHRLLEEVFKRLVRGGVNPSSIHYIKKDPLFKLSAKQSLYFTIAGNKSGKEELLDDIPLEGGDILLITHTNLWNNHNHQIFNRTCYPRREDIRLFIDEARDCQMNKLSFPIGNEWTLKGVLNLFGFKRSIVNTGQYYPIIITPELLEKCQIYLGKKIARKLIKVSGMNNIKMKSNNRKTYAYITMNGNVEEGEFTIQSIMTPFSFLSGWKSFVLLSAMFRSSQFYHLLQLCSNKSLTEDQKELLKEVPTIELIDITDKIISQKRKSEMKKRFSSIYLTYFLTNNLSKEKIDGVVVPEKKVLMVKKYAYLMYEILHNKFPPETNHPIYCQIHTLLDPNLISKLKKVLTDEEQKRLENYQSKLISNCCCKKENEKKIPYNPLDYLTQRACSLAYKWINDPTHKCSKNTKLILININKYRNSKWSFSSDKGILYDTILNDKVKKHSINISGDTRGLDCYKSTDVACFLSSTRLDPLLKRWFNQFCPSYDADKDTLVGTAIQTLLRCSVRDTSSEAFPLVIVATKHMAECIVDTLNSYLGEVLSKENILAPEYFNTSLVTLVARGTSSKVKEKLKEYDRKYHKRDYVRARALAYRNTLDFKVKNYFIKSHIRELYNSYCSIFGSIKRCKDSEKLALLEKKKIDLSKQISELKKEYIKEFSSKWKIDQNFTNEWQTRYELNVNIKK